MAKKRNWQEAKPRTKYAVKIKANDTKSRYELTVYNREGEKVFNVKETYYINGVIDMDASYWNAVKKIDDWLGDYHHYEVYWHNPYWKMCEDIKV